MNLLLDYEDDSKVFSISWSLNSLNFINKYKIYSPILSNYLIIKYLNMKKLIKLLKKFIDYF